MRRGGYIPSGGAPLYLGDFATPMNAVSQRLIGQMVDRVNKKQEQISKGQKEFLELLDFGTTEGLSEKTTERLLKKQQELEDWAAQEYLDSDMSLSLDKQMALRKAKRKYETEAANAKLDVTRFANAQKILGNPQSKYIYDLDKSVGELKRAQKAIENGEPANWQILHTLPPTTGVVRELTKGFGDAESRVVDDRYDYDQGKRFKRYSNVDDVEKQAEAAMQDPLLNQYQGNVQVMENIKSQVRVAAEAAKSEYTVPEALGSSEMGRYEKRQEFERLPKETKEKIQKYPQLRNVKKEEIPSAIFYNEFIHKILRQDATTLEQLKQKTLPGGFGQPTNVEIMGDGSTMLWNKDGESYTIPPTDWTDPGNVKTSMAYVADLIPDSMEGKNAPDNLAAAFIPNLDINVDRAPITSIQNVKNALDKEFDSKFEYTDPKSGEKKEIKVGDVKFREIIEDHLRRVFPDDNFSVPTTWDKKRKFKWGDDEFNLRTEEGRQQLRDKIDRRVKELRGEDSGGTSKINPNADVEDLPEEGF